MWCLLATGFFSMSLVLLQDVMALQGGNKRRREEEEQRLEEAPAR